LPADEGRDKLQFVQTLRGRVLLLVLVTATFLSAVSPAHGGSIGRAEANLREAKNLLAANPNPDSRIAGQVQGLLHHALEQIETKPGNIFAGGEERKKKIVACIQNAIDDLGKENPSKVVDDISTALDTIRDHSASEVSGSGGINETPATNAAGASPAAPPERTTPIVKLAAEQAQAVVLIKGDNAEGTGFLVKTGDGPVVVTNIHVISNNPNLQITASTGAPITILSYKGALDRDLAMIAIKDANYSYIPLATDVAATVETGDEVVTPGNSEGGEVMLNTGGKILGIGPQRVEFDNPIYHGNSGGPVFHTKSGSVIGVVTEAVKIDVSNGVDQASFQSRNSAIAGTMRYFGLRMDNVPGWEAYDWNRLQTETAFLDQFDKRSRCLDSYLNAPDDNKPEDIVYREDDKIMKANNDYFSHANGGDSSQRMDALREWQSDLANLVSADMEAIQNPNNFYAFDQLRAKDEIAYRNALKAELDGIGDDVSRIAGMARKNN
jgi:S1-C subfamily serine protease